ncbi:DNA polymerase subunit beta [Methanopyrus kandleri]
MYPMLRDFLVTEDAVFSVISYVHPEDGFLALMRYVKDPEGDRIRRSTGERYRKVSFEESFEILRERHPEYVRKVRGDFYDQVVPPEDVVEHLHPRDRMERILEEPKDDLEEMAARAVLELAEDSGVPESRFGVTGSLLPELHDPAKSDLDLVVYGVQEFLAVRDAILRIQETGEGRDLLRALDYDQWERVYRRRSPELDFEEFLRHELRKGNRVVIGDRVCDVLLVRDGSELSDVRWEEFETVEENVRLVCEVLDDSLAFDYPARWRVEVVESGTEEGYEVTEVRSYTHTYVGQAFEGEVIEVSGKLEREKNSGELIAIVGSSREAKGEWIRVLKDHR